MSNVNSEEKYYLEFGLEKDPFPFGVIDKNIFLTPEINRRLKYAKQLITSSNKLLVIASLPGAGKSLLAEKLLVLADKDWQSCSLIADEKMDIESLAFKLIQQLLPEQKIDSKLSISMLHKYLETSYKEEVLPVLLIDDAEKLKFETLQFVLQLADLRYNDAMFRIVLFANESISETFTKAGLKELADDTVHFLHMPGFRQDQIRTYLKYRFSSCGENIELPFTDEDITYIHSVSGGLAGGVNFVARQLMLESSIDKKPQKSYAKLSVLLSFIVLVLAGYISLNKSEIDTVDAVKVSNTKTPQSDTNVIGNHSPDAANDLVILGDSISLKLSEFQISNNSSTGDQ
ncbi:MAG: AAA family ATPase [Gammaproteobacteria bacterium]|nr:AAA family ATPase [Gammaproteobacteria bacterium]